MALAALGYAPDGALVEYESEEPEDDTLEVLGYGSAHQSGDGPGGARLRK